MEKPTTEHPLPTLDEIIDRREYIRDNPTEPAARMNYALDAVAALAREVKQLKDSRRRGISK